MKKGIIKWFAAWFILIDSIIFILTLTKIEYVLTDLFLFLINKK